MTTSWKPLVASPTRWSASITTPSWPSPASRRYSCDVHPPVTPMRQPVRLDGNGPRRPPNGRSTGPRRLSALLITPPATSGDGSQRRDKRPLAGDLGRIWDGACTAIMGREIKAEVALSHGLTPMEIERTGSVVDLEGGASTSPKDTCAHPWVWEEESAQWGTGSTEPGDPWRSPCPLLPRRPARSPLPPWIPYCTRSRPEGHRSA